MKTILIFFTLFLCGCGARMNRSIADRDTRVRDFLDRTIAGSQYPGIQYIVVDSGSRVFEYFGGWADIAQRRPMDSSTTMMAYSMSKTFTAAAVMQLIERGRLRLDDSIASYLPYSPYSRAMTIRHLLSQTSGIPDPLPLKWVHLATQHAEFDEDAALKKVLQEHAESVFPPGTKYAYSNISYWLLGKIIERAGGMPLPEYMKRNIFLPLGLDDSSAAYTVVEPSRHAKGYLAMFSFMNLIKGFVIRNEFIGRYEGRWLHINNHYLNGPAFGGIVTTARSVGSFLQDQLRSQSVLMNPETRNLFFTQQRVSGGKEIDMTLGWHIGMLNGQRFYYKEGGGGGYHAEMRIYPHRGIATVIMVNETSAKCTELQSELDKEFGASG